ncbi:hypothetical protein K456DRAFT_1199232 [Colletotrichum gloeosporioides 23]|nr:hypothetical protein K456DRAFT_1199232 [Colletotrichum gloeosporioides 23]
MVNGFWRTTESHSQPPVGFQNVSSRRSSRVCLPTFSTKHSRNLQRITLRRAATVPLVKPRRGDQPLPPNATSLHRLPVHCIGISFSSAAAPAHRIQRHGNLIAYETATPHASQGRCGRGRLPGDHSHGT